MFPDARGQAQRGISVAIQIKWFPPSWVQVKSNGGILYIDPAYLRTYFAKYPKKIEFTKWPDPIDGLPEDLEKADVILITHNHKDHCKGVTIKRLRSEKTLVAAPKSCSKELNQGLKVVSSSDEFVCKDFRIKVVDAYNTENGASTKKNHKKGKGVGYLITTEGKTVYHAGDTDVIPEMEAFGDVDVALVPIGGTYTMNVAEAAQAVSAMRPKVAIPMHHLRADPREFQESLGSEANTEVITLQIGEVYCLTR
jgi:L-ascorbate metabolism protein UlaG (beta-lactamase superfamily)